MTVASDLKERVTVQQRTVSADGYGGQTLSWTTLATVFAQVTAINTYARERTLSEQAAAVAGYRVTMRQRSDVDPSMRILWKTHTLAIHSMHEVGDMLDILTYEETI